MKKSSLLQKILKNLAARKVLSAKVGLRGHVRVFSGECLVFDGPNVITNVGREAALAVMLASSRTQPLLGTLRLGSGGHEVDDPTTPVEPLPTVTALEDMTGPTLSDPDISTDPSGTKIVFNFILAKNQGNGNTGKTYFTEAGLYDSFGNIFAYETFPAAQKDATKVLRLEWSIFS